MPSVAGHRKNFIINIAINVSEVFRDNKRLQIIYKLRMLRELKWYVISCPASRLPLLDAFWYPMQKCNIHCKTQCAANHAISSQCHAMTNYELQMENNTF